jgi:hypothetical protein
VTIGEKEAALRHAREQALLSPRGVGGVRQGEKMSLSTREGVKPATEALAHLSRAVLLLEKSRDLAKVASIRDMVLAAETYARAQRLADEAVRYATEVRVRATRKAGELLAEHRASGPLPRL